MPAKVVSADGIVLFTRADMKIGRSVWQSIGGQQLGPIWGHGALVAPDWSADWLHREAIASLDLRAEHAFGKPYAAFGLGDRAKLQAEFQSDIRHYGYDATSDILTVSKQRATAIAQVAAHYESVFSADPATAALRETHAMKNKTVDTPEHRLQMSEFFFWTAWACDTDRPTAPSRTRIRA